MLIFSSIKSQLLKIWIKIIETVTHVLEWNLHLILPFLLYHYLNLHQCVPSLVPSYFSDILIATSLEVSFQLRVLSLTSSIYICMYATVRNAHLAESQAELCAFNVAKYLSSSSLSSSASTSFSPSPSPSSSTDGMLKYPQGLFGVRECPLLACVSLGKYGPGTLSQFLYHCL